MRKFMYFFIGLLLFFPLVGMSPAKRLYSCCHKDMANMAVSMCEQHAAGMHMVSDDQSSAGQDCCLLDGCSGSIAAKDTALFLTAPPLEFRGMIEEASFSPMMQPMKPGFQRTGLLLAHSLYAPLYTLHCSFLI